MDQVDPSLSQGHGRFCFWSMDEGQGEIVGDKGPGRLNAAFTGAPTWTPGVSAYAGMGLTSWSTANYVTADGAAGIMGGAFPCFMGVGFSWNPGNSTLGYLLHQARSTSTFSQFGLNINAPSAGTGRFILLTSTGTNITMTATGLGLNDSYFHTLMGYCPAPNRQFLFADGVQVASGTTSMAGTTSDWFTIGAQRSNGTVANVAKGIINFACMGNGFAVDPLAFHQNAYESFGADSAARMRAPTTVAGFVFPMSLFQVNASGAF